LDEIPIDLKQVYTIDGDRAIRDISGRPQESLSPFFRDKSRALACLKEDIHNPFNENTLTFDEDFVPSDDGAPTYYMHIDLAKSHDAVGISMCHQEGMAVVSRENLFTKEIATAEVELPLIIFDFIGRLKAGIGAEIILADVREIVYDLQRRGFEIGLITFDQWQSVDSVQILRDGGFVVDNLSIDRTFHKIIVDYKKEDTFTKKESTGKNYIAPMQDLKCGMYEERVHIPYHEWLEKEIKWAEWDLKKNKVDHPPGKSIDMLHSVAGSFFNCINNEYPTLDSDFGVLTDSRGRSAHDDEYYKNLEGPAYNEVDDPYYKEHKFDASYFDNEHFGGDDER